MWLFATKNSGPEYQTACLDLFMHYKISSNYAASTCDNLIVDA